MVWLTLASQTLSIPQCQSLLVPILKAIGAVRGTERVWVARIGLAAVFMDVCYLYSGTVYDCIRMALTVWYKK